MEDNKECPRCGQNAMSMTVDNYCLACHQFVNMKKGETIRLLLASQAALTEMNRGLEIFRGGVLRLAQIQQKEGILIEFAKVCPKGN